MHVLWILTANLVPVPVTLAAARVSGGGLPFNWFDLVVIAMIIVGIFRGRKRGMSAEFLDLIQWLLILGAGGLLYRPVGELFARVAHLGLLTAFVSVYLATAVLIKILFTLFKRTIGEKLIGSDFFGNLEYYLGMLAGAIRFTCMVLFFMAVLSARYFSDAEILAETQAQERELGNVFFPTLGMVHQGVFHDSAAGRFVEKNLDVVLIAPTKPGAQQNQQTIGKRREQQVNDALGIK
ncbi:MAG: CvpA family protein [Candidatus Omnitrophica bacterium]|nr:CvpA family protein [Candidatus Omnitrophota bacterium]